VMENMPCVDATVKEALRVRHPITVGVWRRALEPLLVNGYRIPKVRALAWPPDVPASSSV
jgi:cytochrome P450